MIYMTFNQWADGNFLETGEPRREAYSQAELDLVEMGWNYGYDAGVQWQKSQQALDKKAENARELGLDYEPQRTWVGLTEEEIKECFKITPDLFLPWHIYKRIEAKLKEKNT